MNIQGILTKIKKGGMSHKLSYKNDMSEGLKGILNWHVGKINIQKDKHTEIMEIKDKRKIYANFSPRNKFMIKITEEIS